MTDPTPAQSSGKSKGLAGAVLAAAGILATKAFGVVRSSFQAAFLGATGGIAGDAFAAAIRIPNLLQNLFGEGALSASFVPVYTNLLARGNDPRLSAVEREEHLREAGRVAGAVAAILGLVVAVLVLLGVFFAPQLIPIIAWGFKGDKRDLTVLLTRILFPGAGIFVISAWCLGVLNSHRKYFLSYAAPVFWNLAIIVALVMYGRTSDLPHVAVIAAWASVVGAALQFLVQLPFVLQLVPHLRVSADKDRASVRQVLKNFAPVGVSRGVVQLSAYIDQLIASLLPNGMVSAVFYATTISYTPVSVFGIAVSANELTEMSGTLGEDDERNAVLRRRLDAALRQIAYFVIPSAMALAALGDVLAEALLQHRHFTATDTRYVWSILAGSAIGLLASTMGRLYSSTYYALNDTRTPLNFALIRVGLTTALGFAFALWLPKALGIDAHWGAAGLTASAGIAGWVEFTLLRRSLNRRIGVTGLRRGFVATLWAVAGVAAAIAFEAKLLLRDQGIHGILLGVLVAGGYGVLYLAGTHYLEVPEAHGVTRKLLRR